MSGHVKSFQADRKVKAASVIVEFAETLLEGRSIGANSKAEVPAHHPPVERFLSVPVRLGDRVLGTASARSGSIEIPFLGVPALFSDGPLRLAMLLRRRVIFMVGLYLGGHRYDVRFETLADFSAAPADPAAREQLVQATLRDYVARLERLCREAPYNWFNFYDYWREDTTF